MFAYHCTETCQDKECGHTYKYLIHNKDELATRSLTCARCEASTTLVVRSIYINPEVL